MEEQQVSAHGEVCPDLERLAEYVDGTLPPEAHLAVQAHLADCDRCLELVAEMSAVAGEPIMATSPGHVESASVEPVSAPLRPEPKRRTPFLAIASALAAAALVVIAVGPRTGLWPWGDGASEANTAALIDATRTGRPVLARLSGFDPAPLVSPTRSVTARPGDNLPLLAAARAAEEAAAKRPTAANRHTLGVAQLLIGDTNGAVATLEAVAAERPTDARLLNDLAAAYLSRGESRSQSADFSRALDLTKRALATDPAFVEPLFNQAIALAAMDRRDEARKAYENVIARDSSAWRDEARRLLAELGATPRQ